MNTFIKIKKKHKEILKEKFFRKNLRKNSFYELEKEGLEQTNFFVYEKNTNTQYSF